MGVTAQLPWVGVGMELAALIAGVALATFPYSAEFNGDWLKVVLKMGLGKKGCSGSASGVLQVVFFVGGTGNKEKHQSLSIIVSTCFGG